MTWSLAFTRAASSLPVYISSAHWLLVLLTCVRIAVYFDCVLWIEKRSYSTSQWELAVKASNLLKAREKREWPRW